MKDLTIPLDINNLKVISQALDSKGNIIITVESICTKTTCHKCGKDATKRYGYGSLMEYRHTSVFDAPVILRIKPVRYECEHCEAGTTTTERYDWVAEGGKITKGLEEYLLRCVINSTIQDVAKKERISYKTVQTMLNNLIALWHEVPAHYCCVGIPPQRILNQMQSYVGTRWAKYMCTGCIYLV